MFTLDRQPILQEIKHGLPSGSVQLFIKREDMIHPVISGNKWRKLKYNLEQAKKEGHKVLLTFGGAYSNHIHATAGAARQYGFRSIGIIRGEEHLPLNPTLKQATEMGMDIYYMDRGTYREKHSKQVISDLKDLFGDFYLIPEGGTNELAIRGAAEIILGIENSFDYVVAACGTGGTITGIIAGLQDKARAIGISVLKGGFLEEEVRSWLERTKNQHLHNWLINENYHFGGYAKYKAELIDFINEFRTWNKVPLDPVYTGKMMFGVMDLIRQGYFPAGTRVLAIHTGGLQGIRGFNERFGKIVNV